MTNWFEYFWTSPPNVPEGVGFDLFAGEHLIMFAVMAGIAAVLVVIYAKANDARRRIIRLSIGISVLFLELVLRQGIFLALGIYTPDILPLHACAIATFCVFIDAVKPNSWTREYIYAMGTWGPVCALLFPDWVNQPILNLYTWQAFLIHALLIAYALMILVTKEFRPSVRNLWKVLAIMAVFVTASILCNNYLGTNFWFLATAVPGSPLEPIQSLAGGFYIPLLALLLTVLWTLMYLPWSIKKRTGELTDEVVTSS